MKKFAAVIVLLLGGCADDPAPVAQVQELKPYHGTWEHSGSEYGNHVISDNMLLVFHPDNTVSYKRCINRMNGHTYIKLPDASIKHLSDELLVVSVGWWVLSWSEKLPIARAPYADGNDWYFEVDGLKLRKLRLGERSSHETWKCDSDKKD